MARKDGGAAFPRPISQSPNLDQTAWDQDGMSLRDYFAAAAMQGELACQGGSGSWTNIASLSERCYGIADAMLAERQKGGTDA